jgi:hypothetical protein
MLPCSDQQADIPRMRPIFVGLLLMFGTYAAAFIYRTSFEVGGIRYFCLFDDAMISMRYAKNFAAGMGMVWNGGGEHVEGFTNPLWVLWMAIFHLFPISAAKMSLCIQLSGAVCLTISLIIVRRISVLLFPGSTIAEYVPAIFTAFYIPLLNWSLQGMEVGPLALIAVWTLWMALYGLKKGRVPSTLYWILGASTLVRIDFTLFAGVLLLCLALEDPQNRRRHLLVGGSILLMFLALQTGLRYAYYGELLPNTYYLKVSGVSTIQRLERGVGAFLDFASGISWIIFLFPFLLLLGGPGWGATIVAILFLAQCAYSISVGGDVWEWWGGSNRYIAVVMPLFFILFGGALAKASALSGSYVARFSRIPRVVVILGMSLVVLVTLFQVNRVKGAATADEWFEGGKYLMSTARAQEASEIYSRADTVFRWLLMPEPLEWSENLRMVQASLLLDSITTPGARVAVVRAGTLPYFSDREFVDLLGKNDKTIAHAESRPTMDPLGRMSQTPGHSKWSYAYSIGACKPDVVFELWAVPEEARTYLETDYQPVTLRGHTWYLRRGSPRIEWQAVSRLSG